MPFTSKGFESPKLTVHFGDGCTFLKKHKEAFDVIINDAPEPAGNTYECVLKSPVELLLFLR